MVEGKQKKSEASFNLRCSFELLKRTRKEAQIQGIKCAELIRIALTNYLTDRALDREYDMEAKRNREKKG
jgi:predicted DNA binding CopG/RHH family protein